MQDMALAVEGVDRIDLGDRRRGHRRVIDSPRRRPYCAVAQVDALQLGVAAYLAWRAFGDHPTLIHGGDAISELEHPIHVVLDEQDRHLRHEASNQRRDPFALRSRESDQWFV